MKHENNKINICDYRAAQRNEAKAAAAAAAAAATAAKVPGNLAGLKTFVGRAAPSAEPKMVTIRRVMEPFSAEPTVTITINGSSPDKDEVLFSMDSPGAFITALHSTTLCCIILIYF